MGVIVFVIDQYSIDSSGFHCIFIKMISPLPRRRQNSSYLPAPKLAENIRIDVEPGQEQVDLLLPRGCEKKQLKLQISIFGLIKAIVYAKETSHNWRHNTVIREYSIYLPSCVKQYADVTSKFNDGILSIILPKSVEIQ